MGKDLKDIFFVRMAKAIEEGGGPMAGHLHRSVGGDYAKMITAEEKRLENNQPVWVQLRRENHYLDAEVLATACAEPGWPGGSVQTIGKETVKRVQRRLLNKGLK